MKQLIFALLFFSTSSFAFSELASFVQLKIPQDGKKTWVIFDIDNTLIRPQDEIGSHQWADDMAKRYAEKGHSPAEANAYQPQIFSRAQVFVKPTLVDPTIFSTLAQLEKLKISYLALTARSALSLKDITINQMSDQKLIGHFDQNHPYWNQQGDLSKYTQQGVVFSNGLSKGEILKKLIEAASVKPERIIFIDDRDYNVTSIESAGKELGIEILGYRFSAADYIVAGFDRRKGDREWFAAKYLSSPSLANSLFNPIDLAEKLISAEFAGGIIPYSQRCTLATRAQFNYVNCTADITVYYGDVETISRNYTFMYNSQDAFYTDINWDLF